jgi:uncharacterized membrane protein YhdT
LYCWQ